MTSDAFVRGQPAAATPTLDRTWAPRPGIAGWFMTVNHRSVGLRYIVTAFIFFGLAGLAALAMRLQLAQPGLQILNADLYNQLFTLHGTAMMFLFAVPVMEGLGIYLVPLMIGSRDMAFPKLNAFGYYVFLIAGVTLFASLLFGVAPDGGWFAYVPLTDREFSPGPNLDIWATMVTFIEIAALVAAVELIVTIFKFRAPGMSLNRMPIFVWSILIMAMMIVFAMPAVMVASVFMMLDRNIGTQFFNVAQGGDPLLWQHLFWFFGHPEVYIILLPGLGAVSMIVSTFARRPLLGYTPVVLSTIAIGIVSFGLWVHHMFATGLPILGLSFFTVASMMIAIPSGIQVFAWIGTLLTGRVVLAVPLLYVLAFLWVFIMGGISGVMVASLPFDLQTHDTYFVVAHFHYVLLGGALLPLLGAVHYWFPKFTGKLLDHRRSLWVLWLNFAGINLTFFGMHLLGFLGMPRRVYTYLPGLGWDWLNLISTAGAVLLAVSVLLLIYNVADALRRGAAAPDDPWGAGSLEWATQSPPPQYNFAEVPVVESADPLWTERGLRTMPGSLALDRREVLGTSLIDAEPEARHVLPGPSITPLLLAVAVTVTFLGSVFSLWLVPVGAALAFAALVAWNWPSREPDRR